MNPSWFGAGSISDAGVLVRLGAIGAVMLSVAGAFAYVGGWLSPARLTQARTRPGGRTLRARWRQGVIAVSADCAAPLQMLESSLLQAQYG